MWPFKKKTGPKESPPIIINAGLCIPGLWKDIDEIKTSIFSSSSGEYMVVGDILLSVKRERHYKIEIGGRDDRMVPAFKQLGKTTGISDSCLTQIERHQFIVYISGETGSLKEAENIAFAGAAVLKAGGSAISIDAAGKAFEKSKWLGLIKTFGEADLYQMFVTDSLTDKKGSVWSCGMQNLGLKDTIISGEEFQAAVDVLSIFGYFQIFDKPIIFPNQSFQASGLSPVYKVTEEPNPPNKGSGNYENPYGMWRLTRT
jgi:hypothetical protein